MNDLDRALIADADFADAGAALTKTAVDQHLRNIAAEVFRAGGDALGMFRSNPITTSAAAGALVGGGVNALRAREGESRMQRFGRGAAGGAVAGGLSGLVGSGAIRNIGRMGEEVSHQIGAIRGPQRTPGLDVGHGETFRALGRGLSRSSRRGIYGSARADGTSDTLKGLWRQNDELRRQLRTEVRDPAKRTELAKHLFQNERAISQNAGGHFGYWTAPEAALALGATTAVGGAIGDHVMNKEGSLRARIDHAIDKVAFLGNVGSAIGRGFTNVGAAVGSGMSNMAPAAVTGAIGAVGGAGAAGEGNRIGGAITGGLLGAVGGRAAGSGALGAGGQRFMQSFGGNTAVSTLPRGVV